jgi:hypothetical protein
MARSRWRSNDEQSWLKSFFHELSVIRSEHGVNTAIEILGDEKYPRLVVRLRVFRTLSSGDEWKIASISQVWPNAYDSTWAVFLFQLACSLTPLVDEAMAAAPHLI